jgi:hypothetical protein
MKSGFTPWADLMLTMPYQRVGWFVLGTIERESRLNLDALTAYWLRACAVWPSPLASLAGAQPSEQWGLRKKLEPRVAQDRTKPNPGDKLRMRDR